MTKSRKQSSPGRALGQDVRQARRSRGLTFEDVAEATNLGISTLALAERQGRISLRTARALAPVLGMKVETLLGL